MKKAKLSPRETVMLIILIVLLVGAIYYLGFLTPLKNEIASLQSNTASLETQASTFTEKLAQIGRMKAELQAIKELPEDEISELPPYDNLAEILNDMDKYLRQYSYTYQLSHGDPSPTDDGTYRRSIQLSMKCDSLESAYDIVSDITSGQWRCLITSIGMSPEGSVYVNGGGGINLSLSLTFFELTPSETLDEAPTE